MHARATELHRTVQSVFILRIAIQNEEHDVFRGAPWVQLADQIEANRFRNLYESEAGVNEGRVFGCTHAVSQRIGAATHAGVRIGRLNEVTWVDKFFTRHLVTDARAHAILRRVIADAGVLLENLLHIAQGLNLLNEGRETSDTICVKQVILEDR